MAHVLSLPKLFCNVGCLKDAGGGKKPYSFLPFVFSAYCVTVRTIYSSKLTLFGVLLGPTWLPVLSVIPSVGVGFTLKWFIHKIAKGKVAG